MDVLYQLSYIGERGIEPCWHEFERRTSTMAVF